MPVWLPVLRGIVNVNSVLCIIRNYPDSHYKIVLDYIEFIIGIKSVIYVNLHFKPDFTKSLKKRGY